VDRFGPEALAGEGDAARLELGELARGARHVGGATGAGDGACLCAVLQNARTARLVRGRRGLGAEPHHVEVRRDEIHHEAGDLAPPGCGRAVVAPPRRPDRGVGGPEVPEALARRQEHVGPGADVEAEARGVLEGLPALGPEIDAGAPGRPGGVDARFRGADAGALQGESRQGERRCANPRAKDGVEGRSDGAMALPRRPGVFAGRAPGRRVRPERGVRRRGRAGQSDGDQPGDQAGAEASARARAGLRS
jgi:hypothetical protein